ncbi:f-box-like domain-containing protein [Ditylenchus destructor]|nr:f-box-like domain-containing protein [Ditylenchus destructor]
MDDDILIDVFRPLPRKQLSQSVALVCRRFRYLVNSAALPNLHHINYGTHINDNYFNCHFKPPDYPIQEWGFVTHSFVEGGPVVSHFITYEELQTTHRPTQYLRFAQLFIRPEYLAKDQWRKCLWEFRHCFANSTLKLDMCAQFTAVEFQCFLVDWILRLFPNCVYLIEDCTFISNTDNKIEDLPSLEALANFSKSKFLQFRASDRQAVVSCLEPSLLISHPSLFNCPCVEIKASLRRGDRYCDSFVPQEDVIKWLHHVPEAPTTRARFLPPTCRTIRSKRYLLLNSAMLKPREEDRRDDWCQQIAQVSHSVVEQIKKRFLVAKTSEEKREFYLELDAFDIFDRNDIQSLEPFDIQNDATNERLTLTQKILYGDFRTGAYIYALWRKSA